MDTIVKSLSDSNGTTLVTDGVTAIIRRKNQTIEISEDTKIANAVQSLAKASTGRASKTFSFNPERILEAIGKVSPSDVIHIDIFQSEKGAFICISDDLDCAIVMSLDSKSIDYDLAFTPIAKEFDAQH